MFRLETQLELLISPEPQANAAPPITLRGHSSEEPVAVTGEFIGSPALSIGDIVGYCPTYRDLYFRKQKLHAQYNKPSARNWAREAGLTIQKFYEYVYAEFKNKRTPGGVGTGPNAFRKEVTRLADEFIAANARRFTTLDGKVKEAGDLRRDELRLLLINSSVFDLFYLQGALNYSRPDGSAPPASLCGLELQQKYTPASHLKISENSTPDFILPGLYAIGDMKSGAMREEYFETVTGYALGYESAKNIDINLGVIYLVETTRDCIQSSRAIVFWISNDLRRRFLDRRDRVLNILAKGVDPAAAQSQFREKFCANCAYRPACFTGGDLATPA